MKQILRGTPKILVLKFVIKLIDKKVHSVKKFICSGVTGWGPATFTYIFQGF